MKLRYSFSEKEECQQIHEYSLDILENTGIVVHSEKARNVFKKNGAKAEGKKVFLPPKIVEDRLVDVPSRTPCNRGRRNHLYHAALRRHLCKEEQRQPSGRARRLYQFYKTQPGKRTDEYGLSLCP